MRSARAAIVLLVAAICLLAARPADAATLRGPTQARAGEEVLLSATGRASVPAAIERRLPGRWVSVAAGRSDSAGLFVAKLKLPAKWQQLQFRARFKFKGSWSYSPVLKISQAQAPRVGFNNNAVAYKQLSAPAAAAQLAAAGADIDRVQIDWSRLELSPGNYNFAVYDAIYAADLAAGVRPLFIFAFAPEWANGGICPDDLSGCHAPPLPQYYDEAAATAAVIAARYPYAAGIEIWNEPNAAYFWQPTPNASAYAALLKRSYTAIKQVAPAMPVAAGSMAAGLVYGPGKIYGAEFLRRMYAAGAAGSFDAISTHAYADPAISSAVRDINAVKRIRNKAGQRTPIWITETGISSTGERAVSEAAQAEIVADLYDSLTAIRGVQMFLVHTLIEPPRASWDEQTGFGLLRGDLTRKPAYCALLAAWAQSCS